MANKDLKPEPHDMGGGWWWYETSGGIEVVAADKDSRPGICKIPWRSIRAALKRKDQ